MDKMNIREFPEQAERVENGPIQFGQDWPGVFLRGDCAGPNAMYLGLVLDAIDEYNKTHDEPLVDVFTLLAVRSLQSTLTSCMLNCGG